jgi:hypothetical protein
MKARQRGKPQQRTQALAKEEPRRTGPAARLQRREMEPGPGADRRQQ